MISFSFPNQDIALSKNGKKSVRERNDQIGVRTSQLKL